MNNNQLQAVDFKTGVTVAAVSPGSQMSPDLTPKSALDASLSPVPYMFGRVKKTGAVLEKVIERRQKRMIKNRESAARSRARKQVSVRLNLEIEVSFQPWQWLFTFSLYCLTGLYDGVGSRDCATQRVE